MKSFTKVFISTLISLVFMSSVPSPASVGTDSLKLSKDHWLYFGWKEDHPKAISLMGGALYPRRPVLEKHDDHSWEYSMTPWHKDSDKPVFFMVSVDGSVPYYPDETSPSRRKDIRWTRPEVDLETWGFGFIRQTMLQMCISVKADKDVIIGRGIPDSWIESGRPIKWERVHIAGGKTISLSIQKSGDTINIAFGGDVNDGGYIIDIPYCVGQIAGVEVRGRSVLSKDYGHGKVTVSGSSTDIIIKLASE